MLKIRLQGTKKDIQWFIRVLTRHQYIKVINVSELLINKGTKSYYRIYVEVKKAD